MRFLVFLFLASAPWFLFAASPESKPGVVMLERYFAGEVSRIERDSLPMPVSREAWETTRVQWRADLADMLGLAPMPERTPLHAVKTGEVAGDGFVVEKLHFQSMPGLYVTANLYRPTAVEKPLPTILYGCGHSNMKAKDGGSLGNKTGYQHHGSWFARHGYVCLIIDTVQLGEIRGEHHGTYSKERWWWISRGYTPAGVEAWAGIRALDYLETRPEVDRQRIGMTGRSGGGAYTWWVAALDDRIKVAAPTAGITTLHDHVVEGVVAGHCDCMFMGNSRQWDYDRVAALIAPRPLLISNTDKDTIFPLPGVITIYNHVRALYRALGVESKIGLQIAEGPHKDTQPLNAGAFAWFERFLKGADPMDLLDEPARKLMEPEALRVFAQLPADELNTRVDQTFVKTANVPPVPKDVQTLDAHASEWKGALMARVFAAWPAGESKPVVKHIRSMEDEGIATHTWEMQSQSPWLLPMLMMHRAELNPGEVQEIRLHVVSESEWPAFEPLVKSGSPDAEQAPLRAGAARLLPPGSRVALAFVVPRGIGPTDWSENEKIDRHRLRRFYLLGQTLDGMRVWDILQSTKALEHMGYGGGTLRMYARGVMAGNALYAALFATRPVSLDLAGLPPSHHDGPHYLNVLRILDLPQALGMALLRSDVRLQITNAVPWHWPEQTAKIPGLAGSLETTNVDQPSGAFLSLQP